MNTVVILAGGKGSRMNILLPKTLVKIAGSAMIERIVRATKKVCEKPLVVIGYQGEKVKNYLGDACEYIRQERQLGTGHAIGCVKKYCNGRSYDNIVVIPGDHPLVSEETLTDLINKRESSTATVVVATVVVPNFEGEYASFYNCGRILRDKYNKVKAIVELKDANKDEREIKEVNVSFYCFKADWLWLNVDDLENKNVSKEYYITDLVQLARENNNAIATITLNDFKEGLGVNTQEQRRVIDSFIA